MKNVLVFGLLFLAAMNFQAKFFYFVFICFFVLFVAQRHIKMYRGTLIYLGLSLLMALYNADEGILSMLRCLAPFCFYLVGTNVVANIPKQVSLSERITYASKQGYTVLVMISLGSFAHYIMNFIYNLGNSLERNTNDIWSGVPMAATGQSALACLMLGLSIAMLFLPFKKWHRYVGMVTLVLMLLYNLRLAVRTSIITFLILLCMGMLYPKKRRGSASRPIKYFLGIGILAIGITMVYTLNVGGIQEYLRESLLFDRFDGSLHAFLENEERTNAKVAFLVNAWKYPFGGLHMRERYGYAHDLLLDGYDEYGVVALILMVVILIMGIVALYKLLRYTSYPSEFKIALLMIYTAVLLEFTVEPILVGMPWLFACYCLINGCMVGMNSVFSQHQKEAGKKDDESITN